MTAAPGWTREEGLVLAASSGLPVLDLSQGIAGDAPPVPEDPPAAPLAEYPASAGSAELRAAAATRLHRSYGVHVPTEAVAACVGTKEFISTLPLLLRHIRRSAGPYDTVLVPALGYPPYAYGAELAGLRVVRVPTDRNFRMRLDALSQDDVRRALCLWINSPANPTGVVEPLADIVRWGRENGVVVLSDEAYSAATWSGEPQTALSTGLSGVLAVHSLSKRSNSPQVRAGFYAGDPDLVAQLVVRRRLAGLMAGAVDQHRARWLLLDEQHAVEQRIRTRRRVRGRRAVAGSVAMAVSMRSSS